MITRRGSKSWQCRGGIHSKTKYCVNLNFITGTATDNESAENICTICWRQFDDAQRQQVTLSCTHADFCKSCVKKLLKHQNIAKCPVCRQQVESAIDDDGNDVINECTCIGCAERFDNAQHQQVTLSCNHAHFCKMCVKRLFKHANYAARCPVCRQPILSAIDDDGDIMNELKVERTWEKLREIEEDVNSQTGELRYIYQWTKIRHLKDMCLDPLLSQMTHDLELRINNTIRDMIDEDAQQDQKIMYDRFVRLLRQYPAVSTELIQLKNEVETWTFNYYDAEVRKTRAATESAEAEDKNRFRIRLKRCNSDEMKALCEFLKHVEVSYVTNEYQERIIYLTKAMLEKWYELGTIDPSDKYKIFRSFFEETAQPPFSTFEDFPLLRDLVVQIRVDELGLLKQEMESAKSKVTSLESNPGETINFETVPWAVVGKNQAQWQQQVQKWRWIELSKTYEVFELIVGRQKKFQRDVWRSITELQDRWRSVYLKYLATSNEMLGSMYGNEKVRWAQMMMAQIRRCLDQAQKFRTKNTPAELDQLRMFYEEVVDRYDSFDRHARIEKPPRRRNR